MSIWVLIGLDPFSLNVDIDFIKKFNTIDDVYIFMQEYLENNLNNQKTSYISGLKGDINTHIRNYLKFFKEYNYLNYYGEFKNPFTYPGACEYKWKLFKL
jgi:hypothetical protein